MKVVQTDGGPEGPPSYECALGHRHGSATFAVLCEGAPRLDVRHEFRVDGTKIVEGYFCKRCGAYAPSAFLGLATIDHPREREGPGVEVARVANMGEDPNTTEAWRAEAQAFHDAHTGCMAEGQ